jgi:large subunit ribosomal protein L19
MSQKNIVPSEKKNSIDYIQKIENKFIQNLSISENERNLIRVGDILRIGYSIPEGEKERTQFYEGLVISKNNRGLGKTFTLRRSVQGIGVEQIFCLYSPKIISLLKKQSSKVRRAKLYFIRSLTGKAARLKAKLAVYKAQRHMAEYCEKYGIDISDSDTESDYVSEDEEVQI